MKKIKGIISAALLLGSSAGFAQVILSENFETMADNAQLFGALDTFQSNGQANGAADWLTGQDYGSGAPGTGFNGEGGSTAIHFDKTAGTSNLQLKEDDQFDLAAAYNATLAHKVSFDFYYDSATTQVGDFRLFMTDTTGGLADGLDFNFFSVLRQVRPSNGGSGYGTAFDVDGGPNTQLNNNTWYRYELTINPLDTATDTYSVVVFQDGVGEVINSGVTPIAFDSNIADIGRMEFQMFNASGVGDAYFDNLSVTAIPEASTLTLMGVALLGLLASRRFAKKK